MTLRWSPGYAAVDADFDSVSLLLHGDGTNGSTTIVDSSLSPKDVETFGNAQISTAIADPFGNNTGVLEFDGNGDYLRIPYSSSLQVQGGPFTVELFARIRANTTAFYGQSLIGVRDSGVSTGWGIGHYLGQIAGNIGNNGSGLVGSINLNTWQHIALTYDGTNGRLFLDGNLLSTFAAVAIDNSNPLVVCNQPTFDNVRSTNGFISQIRITKGVARYTSNFTLPTAPFPDASPTTRLTLP